MNVTKTCAVLIFIGFVAFLIRLLFSSQKANIGGLIMIGPIPIAFGTSPDTTIIAMLLGILLMILFFIIRRRNENIEEKGFPDKDFTERPGTKIEGGGVLFIGPIPIVFGSDNRFAIIVIILAIVLMLLAIIVFH